MILIPTRLPSVAVTAAWAATVAGCAWVPTRPDPAASPDQSAAGPSRRGESFESDLSSLRAQVVDAHNRTRAEAKLRPLEVSTKLQAAAESHARDMAAHQKMSHEGSEGSRPVDRIKAQGYTFRRIGENVAAGYFTVDQVMKVWMNSPHHRRNILGGFSQIGVGCATGEDGKRYWCVTFGLPARR
jgi:uncharacterized protein YkwD